MVLVLYSLAEHYGSQVSKSTAEQKLWGKVARKKIVQKCSVIRAKVDVSWSCTPSQGLVISRDFLYEKTMSSVKYGVG